MTRHVEEACELAKASFIVAAGHRFGSPFQKFHDCSVAEFQLMGELQVGTGSKGDN
jgi:hypothetical protein